MAITMRSSDRAEVIREMALELLEKADLLDGTTPCTCGHRRTSHQSGLGAWTGFCSESDLGIGSTDQCGCEEFEAW